MEMLSYVSLITLIIAIVLGFLKFYCENICKTKQHRCTIMINGKGESSAVQLKRLCK